MSPVAAGPRIDLVILYCLAIRERLQMNLDGIAVSHDGDDGKLTRKQNCILCAQAHE